MKKKKNATYAMELTRSFCVRSPNHDLILSITPNQSTEPLPEVYC